MFSGENAAIYRVPFNVHAHNITTQYILLRKSQEIFDTEIMKKLRKCQHWAKSALSHCVVAHWIKKWKKAESIMNSFRFSRFWLILRACLYEAGWPASELARLQVRSNSSGHGFVNISLPLYAYRAGPPCRDPGYPVPGSRFKRTVFSHTNGREHISVPWILWELCRWLAFTLAVAVVFRLATTKPAIRWTRLI